MTLEHFILAANTALCIASIFYIPKEKYRLALISFVAFQALTWATHIFLIQLGVIEYPIRLFVRATKGGILHNFLFYPTVFTWFILLFPNKASLAKKVFHYFSFVSIIVWYIYFIAIYTGLEKFLKGTQFSNVIRLYVMFFIVFITGHAYIRWFSKKVNLSNGG